MSLITPEYLALQKEFHANPAKFGQYGISGHKYAEIVLGFTEKIKSRDVLDYGCGQRTLQASLPFPIKNYDPCIAGFDTHPSPSDIVICTDVLEHIEPDCLMDVLVDLHSLTNQILFLQVATRPAKKVLPDGRNAHLIQEDANWWLERLLPIFALQAFQASPGEFSALVTPITFADEVKNG